MVLFYGKVMSVMSSATEDGVFGKMSQLFLNTKPQKAANKVSIVGGKDAVKFIHQLHFAVPPSATSFHLSKQCTTLLPHGKLVDIEASPHRSKSRRLQKDPGTRVETNGQGDMLFRRLGDERLTFFQVDYGTPNARFNYVSWVSLCQGVSSIDS
ncbi:hypothetical protein EON65_19910 [archaeon]|nr:MAG: hypothetical protein EON65_19910 [archaeon]